MVHRISVNDKTKEGKLLLELIKAMKPSRKAVEIDSPDFSIDRLVFGKGSPLTEEELELLSAQAEKSRGVSLTTIKRNMKKKLASINETRSKKAG